MTTAPTRVVVVGGGAGGVVTAATLLRRAGTATGTAVEVTVVERAPVVGPGLAYATTDPHHLLNNYVARMSAVEDDPQHLLRWCRAQGLDVTGATFLPRETYGRYLAGVLGATPVPAGCSLRTVRDEAVGLTDTGSGYRLETASGAVLEADVVVLALGNPPPRRPRGVDVDADRLVADPWAPGLLDRVGEDDRVLLVGTGLTAVDVAVQIAAARPRVRITATSRHALLPLRHVPEPPGPATAFDGDVRTLRAVLAEARRCVEDGEDWRCLVESLKLIANDVWTGLSREDREQFSRHVARHWEIARHRMAPAMAALVDDLLATGRLTLAPSTTVDTAAYDVVVNCTGPAPVGSTGWNPLVDALAVTGMLWPGPLGLGLDLDTEGALVDAGGVAARGVYAVGAARRGAEWEVAAVPDLRRQAERLADHLAAREPVLPAELVG